MKPARAERLFALILRLLPHEFVAEYGADETATFARRAVDARRRGRARWTLFLLRELAGLARIVALEQASRLGRLTRRTSHEGPGNVEHVLRESRHATRRLLRTPGFSAAAVVTLALALAANTAIFALLYRVVLSPLPYPAAGRLIALEHAAPGVGLASDIGMTVGLYREYGRLPAVESIALYQSGAVTLSGTGDAERLEALFSTPSLGGLLGARPVLGRWLTEADGAEGSPNVALLTHALWVRRFSASRALLGRTVRLDGTPYEVIGVLPPTFVLPDQRAAFVLPLKLSPSERRLGGFNYRGIARLRAGTSAEEARRQQNAVIADLPARFPESPEIARTLAGEAKLTSLAQPLVDHVLGGSARMLWAVFGSVTVILLIACANLANLFLVRLDSRWREVAVRSALGAGAGKLAAFFLAEAMIVAMASGVLGLLLGNVALEALVRYGPVELPRLHEVRIDLVVGAFVLLAAAAAGLGLGLLPLARRLPSAATVLQEAGRGNTTSGGRMRFRQILMATQVALAVVLLVAAGLMVQSVYHLRRVDPGFRADSRLVFRVGLPESDYRTDDAAAAFHDRLLGRLRAVPGVREAAFSTTLPLEGDGEGDPLEVRGGVLPTEKLNPVARFRRVSADYFAALGIPLRAGRLFDASDANGRTDAAVVNEALARLYFPGAVAVGRQLRRVGGKPEDGWLTVVGLVGNTATYGLSETAPVPQIYLPPRSGVNERVSSTHSVSYVVRTKGDPVALVPVVRRAMAELDPGVALARPEALADIVARAGAGPAFTMVLLFVAATVALLLGLVGVYGVIAYGVKQRTGEIGVRLALGARPADVRTMIVRQSGTVIACGVVLGVIAAALGTRPLRALLFGVLWNDALTYAAVAVGIFMVAMLACWIPAARAARVDPLEALR